MIIQEQQRYMYIAPEDVRKLSKCGIVSNNYIHIHKIKIYYAHGHSVIIWQLYKDCTSNLKELDRLANLGIDGRIILKYILKTLTGSVCILDLSGSGKGPVAGSCKHGNELLDSIKLWLFLD